MSFFGCVKYLALIGITSFFVGRAVPKKWFHHNKFPYRSYCFEQGGRLYEKIRIRSWHQKLPDMSRICPKWIPPKKIGFGEGDRLPEMIRETCVAEMIHGCLCLCGLYCIVIWEGMGGVLLAILNILGNMPFILAQRYNRPRMVNAMNRAAKRSRICEC